MMMASSFTQEAVERKTSKAEKEEEALSGEDWLEPVKKCLNNNLKLFSTTLLSDSEILELALGAPLVHPVLTTSDSAGKTNNLQLKSYYAHDIPKHILSQCFEFVKELKDMYIRSGWGWNEEEKLKEMTDKKGRYWVIVDDTSSLNDHYVTQFSAASGTESSIGQGKEKVVGFLYFQFCDEMSYDKVDINDKERCVVVNAQDDDLNDNDVVVHHDMDGEDDDEYEDISSGASEESEEYVHVAVTYIYELHISPSYRKQGISRCLIDNLEKLSQLLKVRKMMLTVFTENPAKKFWQKCGFELDNIDPSVCGMNCKYEIRSKRVDGRRCHGG